MEELAATTTTKHELVPQLRFPPGFRFVPTEEELVDVYLRAKIEGHQLPLNVVNDVSILDWQPGRLVEEYKGYGENRWFFFTKRLQSSSNKVQEPSRKVMVDGVTATWKATWSVQLIRRSRSKLVVGTKRVLIYNSSDPDENGKWSMQEYILKGHAEMGQCALYSIQRKQHSDTEHNAGNGDMDPEKKTKKRKRKRTETLTPCTALEGVQLQHTETTTLPAEPPLKPTRKAKAQRKKKPSLQVGIEGEHHHQQGHSPPKKDELVPSSQQELRQQQTAADGAPASVVLSAVPLQAVRVCPPSEPDGTPGASAPKPEEETLDMSQLFAVLYPAMLWNNQGQEQTGSTAFLAAPDTTSVVVDHAPFLPCQQKEDSYNSFFGLQNQQHIFSGETQSVYVEQWWQHADYQFLMDNTTQLMNCSGGWEHGDDQLHQIHQQQQQQQEENNGGAYGVVQDQQPMNHHPQGGHDLTPSDEQSSGSDESVRVDAFVRGVLDSDEPPQDLADGTHEQQEGGDGPATLQAAGTQEQGADDDTAALQSLHHDDLLAWLQLQRARSEYVWDEPCSCMICVEQCRPYDFEGPVMNSSQPP